MHIPRVKSYMSKGAEVTLSRGADDRFDKLLSSLNMASLLVFQAEWLVPTLLSDKIGTVQSQLIGTEVASFRTM